MPTTLSAERLAWIHNNRNHLIPVDERDELFRLARIGWIVAARDVVVPVPSLYEAAYQAAENYEAERSKTAEVNKAEARLWAPPDLRAALLALGLAVERVVETMPKG